MDFEKVELAGGRAVLYRGDSLDLLAAGLLKCDAIVSDPPYGIGFQHDGRGSPMGVRKTDKIIGDDAPFDPGPRCSLVGALSVSKSTRNTSPQPAPGSKRRRR